MGRLAGVLTFLVLAACGESVLIIGDAPGTMRIVAGVGDSTGTRIEESATRTLLTDPIAPVFVDPLLYFADQGAVRIVNGIEQPLGRVFAVASDGSIEAIIDDGGCTGNLCLLNPVAMVVGADGRLLIADETGNRVFALNPSTRALTVFAGTGSTESSPDGTPVGSASLARPGGIVIGDDGAIYVTEQAAHRIRVIRDGVLGTVAGTGMRGFAGDGGLATSARLDAPTALAFAAGLLFVADAGNHRVRAVDLGDGTIRTLAGTGISASAGDGGPAVDAPLAAPSALAVTPDGQLLYIAERDGHRVRIVNRATGIIETFAGTGAAEFLGGGRPAGQSGLDSPTGLALSGRGFLYIADTGNAVVWRTTVLF